MKYLIAFFLFTTFSLFSLAKQGVPKPQFSINKIEVIGEDLILIEKKNHTEPTLKELKLDVHRTSIAELIQVLKKRSHKNEQRILIKVSSKESTL